MKKFIVNIFIIIFIFSIFLFTVEEQNVEKVVTEKQVFQEETYSDITNQDDIVINNPEKQYPKEDIENTYKGYSVCAKLEIPVISLETNILTEYSEEALKISPTKFWGVNANKIGNFCVVGHNFINDNMFHDLKKLEIGDNLFIIDNEIGRVEYEIFEIYKVLPEDVSPLDAVTVGQREVTLITCTSDSKERIIVKAKEKIMEDSKC